MAKPAGQRAPGPSVLAFSMLALQSKLQHSAFMWVLETQAQVLMLHVTG